MTAIFKRYKELMQHKHGWELELGCPKCNWQGKPNYQGWTPSRAMSLGKSCKIYANLTCPRCGNNLKEEAAKRLTEMFSGIPTSAENKRFLFWFIIFIIGVPLLIISLGGSKTFTAFGFLIFFIFPAIIYFNYKVASLRNRCACGKPNYLFMGMLGRSYCYRCSSCGRLLRLRD